MAFNDIAPIGVTFEVDTSGLRKAESAISGVGSNVSKKMGGFGKTAGIALAAGITAGLVGVGRLISNALQQSVTSASNLEQQYGALDSVFGTNAESMKAFSKEARELGLSSEAAARLTSLLGTQLTGFGYSSDEAAEKTKNLTTLASDLAATYGGTTADAVQSISGILKGEYNPIEKYGVALRKSDVSARLAAQGLGKLTGEALKQAEAQAALELLYEKTTAAQGQGKREYDSYAASQQRLQADTENLRAAIGGPLLDSLSKITQAFSAQMPVIQDKLVPAITTLADKVATDLVPKLIEALPAIIATLGWFVDNIEGIIGFTAGLGGLIGTMKVLNVVTALQSGIFKAHPILALASILIPLIAYLVTLGIKTGFFTDMFKRLGDTMNFIGAVISKIVKDSTKAISGFFTGIFEFLGGMGETLYNFGKEAWQRFVQGALDALLFLPGLAADIIENVPLVGEGIANGIRTVTGGVRNAVSTATGTQNTGIGKQSTPGNQQVNYFNVSAQGLTVDAVTKEAQKIGNLRAPILGGA